MFIPPQVNEIPQQKKVNFVPTILLLSNSYLLDIFLVGPPCKDYHDEVQKKHQQYCHKNDDIFWVTYVLKSHLYFVEVNCVRRHQKITAK